jgi:hypothetical protein
VTDPITLRAQNPNPLTLPLTGLHGRTLTSSPGAPCSTGKYHRGPGAPVRLRHRWAEPSRARHRSRIPTVPRARTSSPPRTYSTAARSRTGERARRRGGPWRRRRPWSPSRGGRGEAGRSGQGEKDEMVLGFCGERLRRGVLPARDGRTAVGFDPTAAERGRARGPLLAQAGSRFPGPGPGCGLVRGEASRAGVLPRWAGPRWAILGSILDWCTVRFCDFLRNYFNHLMHDLISILISPT